MRVLNIKQGTPRFFDRLLIQEADLEISPQNGVYQVLMAVSYFVSQLTDSNALSLSSILNGKVM